jgi:parallel beta-helix repeat protein
MFMRGRAKPAPILRRLTIVVATISTIVAASAAAAAAANRPWTPRCGAMIAHSTTLYADLTGCPGDGLVVAADGVNLNLNGHVVASLGTPGTVGVRVVGRRNVTVTGGRVQGFRVGVYLAQTTHSRVAGVTALHNTDVGIVLSGAPDNTILDNDAAGSDVGVYLGPASARNVVKANTATENVQGITLDRADGNDIDGNRLSGNSDNLIISAAGNHIHGNIVTDAIGCPDGCGYGISLEAGRDNTVEGNQVFRTVQDAIRVAAFDPDQPTTGNVVRGNVVRAAAVDGIAVGTTGDGVVLDTVVTGNVAVTSDGDGIHVAAATTRVTANVATGNGRYGIEAVAGTRDGGRNIAFANRGPAQCLNIRCSTALR